MEVDSAADAVNGANDNAVSNGLIAVMSEKWVKVERSGRRRDWDQGQDQRPEASSQDHRGDHQPR